MTATQRPTTRATRLAALLIVLWLVLGLTALAGVGLVKAWGHGVMAFGLTAFVVVPLMVAVWGAVVLVAGQVRVADLQDDEGA